MANIMDPCAGPNISQVKMLPLAISAGPRAIATAAVASAYYADAGIAAIVVRPRECATHDTAFPSGTRFIDDESLPGMQQVKAFLKSQQSALNQFHRTPGWFLQQFIKLVAVVEIGAQRLFLADGDTIFSHALLATVLREPTILTTGETYGNYDRLLVALGLTPPRSSCVANGNVFSPLSLIRELASPDGFENLMRKHVLASKGALDFSEYQITGSLLEPSIGSRRIKMFRRFDLLVENLNAPSSKAVAKALLRYDAVAIEVDHHRSMAKRAAAHFLYGIGRSW